MNTPTATTPLLSQQMLDQARVRLIRHYSSAAVEAELDWAGRGALSRGDLAGVARAICAAGTGALIRFFLLGEAVDEPALAAVLGTDLIDELVGAHLASRSAGAVRALVEIRPYCESDPSLGTATAAVNSSQAAAPQWWVVSDFGSDVRPGPLASQHVLGIGAAAISLAQAAVRRPVGRALDIGTGCGVQALHLTRHAEQVVATDISERCLRFAATTAALSGEEINLRAGSLLQPVAGEKSDLILSNPPFVISPGWRGGAGGFDYRDSGEAGDLLCRRLVGDLPQHLSHNGVAQLMLNWAITDEVPTEEVVASWLPPNVDAWIWQREVADPGEYVCLWLRDAGVSEGTPAWRAQYEAWVGWFEQQQICGVGMGLLSLRRSQRTAVHRFDDVPQPLEQPIGRWIEGWFDRAAWLGSRSDDDLLNAPLQLADDLQVQVQKVPSAEGWREVAWRLRLTRGLRWEVETDEVLLQILSAVGHGASISLAADILSAVTGAHLPEVRAQLGPLVRDLLHHGLLIPSGYGQQAVSQTEPMLRER